MYKLTEEQRKKLINYFAQKPYMESATMIAMLASLEKVGDNTHCKKTSNRTYKGRQRKNSKSCYTKKK